MRAHAAVGVDSAEKNDAWANAVVARVDMQAGADHAPIPHFVVVHLEQAQGSRAEPLMLDEQVARVVALARAHSAPNGQPASVVFDPHLGVQVASKLHAAGFRAADSIERLGGGRKFFQCPMHVAAQTARFRLLRELVNGRRLHAPDTRIGRELVAQLKALAAWELRDGLRVEGKGQHDDLVDAVLLAIDACQHLPPSGGDGLVEFRHDGVSWRDGLSFINPRWIRRMPDGRELPAEHPEWDRDFGDYAADLASRGTFTAATMRWFARQTEEHVRELGIDPRMIWPGGTGRKEG